MKRIGLVVLSAVFLVGCQESEPTRPLEGELISLDISDGASGGNDEFFFYPPLADDPRGHPNFDEGAFNEFLAPFVKFCHLTSLDPVVCDELDVAGQVEFPMQPLPDQELYKFNWHTSDFDLIDEQNYRIEVYVGSVNVEGSRLGYRDVTPLSGPPIASCTTEHDFCQINNGSTVPIKVRIEDKAFCPVDDQGQRIECQTKSTDFTQDTRWEVQGNSYYALDVPTQPGENGTVTITFRECAVDDVEDLTDLWTYGPCFETDILATTTEFDGVLDPGATAVISFCDMDPLVWDPPLSESQEALLRLHSFHEDGSIEALREAAICPEQLGSLPANPVLRLASWIGDRVGSWIGVRPLMASAAQEPPSRTSRGGDSEGTIRTKFKFALPAKIDYVDPADASRIALAGSELTTQAKVTDLYGNGVAGATVRWNVLVPPDEGADVEGTVSPAITLTDANGIAEATWTLGEESGWNKLSASGRGLADSRETGCETADGSPRNCNGPRGSGYMWGNPFDPFVPVMWDETDPDGDPVDDDIHSPEDELAELIAVNTRLLFSAFGCEPGFGTPIEIDGTIDPGEWVCAVQQTFPVNLSGGSTVDATLYYMNDDTHFHLAVVVPGTGRENGLRVDWDGDGDLNAGGRELGDDVWEFDPEDGAADKFVDEKCSDSSQSGCGNDDDAFSGSMDTEAAFDNSGGQTVYEMSHPLAAGDQRCGGTGKKYVCDHQEIDLNVSADDTRGLFLTLRLGRGAQGNTQWPGFLDYLPIIIK